MSDVSISVRGLGKRYRIWTHSPPTNLSDRLGVAFARARRRPDAKPPRREEIWALRDVSFDVHRGEVLGVIGPNGAGKSTLLSVLARITEPSEGEASIAGRVGSLLEVGTGFHPELSGRDNVFLNGAILGMSRSEVAQKFDQIVEFSGVRDFIDMPVKRYSSGMYVRLGFAVAAHLDPEVLLLDEVLAVGDRSFQEKCLRRIDEITHDGRTVLFVSHDVDAVARLCRRAVVIGEGRLIFDGPADEAVECYLGSPTLGGELPVIDQHEGSGEVRVASVTVQNADGGSQIHADHPVAIRVEFEGREAVRGPDLVLRIGVNTPGGLYVLLSSEFDGAATLAEGIEPGSVISCVLDSLPLKPGPYHVSVTVERMGEVVDRIANAAAFRVVPSDVFGTGIVPTDTYPAPVVVAHRWRLEEQVLVPTHVEQV
jgi:lipopolysaccharide transport system ATP-binding protein